MTFPPVAFQQAPRTIFRPRSFLIHLVQDGVLPLDRPSGARSGRSISYPIKCKTG